MHTRHHPLRWAARFSALFLLYAVLFGLGAVAVSGLIPEGATTDPGLVSPTSGLLLIALCHVALIGALILTSRWQGWRLALALSLAWYGVVTFITQIETWYFLTAITVGPELLPRLFVMGLPTAFIFIPLAVWWLGRWRTPEVSTSNTPAMPLPQWLWKLALLSVVYVALYWSAGYFIAWQNPQLRAFYGQPGEAVPFLDNLLLTLRNDPGLFPFQALRAQIWVACALPIIHGSRLGPGWTALLVGLMYSLPQNIGHILANPLIPDASVRMSHLVETASSTFVFGLCVVWLLHRRHDGLADLLGRHRPGRG